MKAGLENLLSAVRSYGQNYRNPRMHPFDVAEPYDMSPERDRASVICSAQWPEIWPHAGRAGIYAFLNEGLEVIYVGKASLRNSLGARISSYCGYGTHRECRFYGEWKNLPRYVLVVAVPDETRFEAPALEEYLIRELQPSDNSTGIERYRAST